MGTVSIEQFAQEHDTQSIGEKKHNRPTESLSLLCLRAGLDVFWQNSALCRQKNRLKTALSRPAVAFIPSGSKYSVDDSPGQRKTSVQQLALHTAQKMRPVIILCFHWKWL